MRPTASSSGSARPRATSTTACGSSSSARTTARRRFVRAREILAKAEDSPERQEAAAAGRRPARPPARDALGDRAGARRVAAGAGAGPADRSFSMRGIRLEREALAAVVAHPDLADALAGLGEEHFDARRAPPDAGGPDRRRAAGARSRASPRGARRDGVEARGSRGARARRCSCACASASSGAICRARPTWHARRSSRRTSRRCARRSPSSRKAVTRAGRSEREDARADDVAEGPDGRRARARRA